MKHDEKEKIAAENRKLRKQRKHAHKQPIEEDHKREQAVEHKINKIKSRLLDGFDNIIKSKKSSIEVTNSMKKKFITEVANVSKEIEQDLLSNQLTIESIDKDLSIQNWIAKMPEIFINHEAQLSTHSEDKSQNSFSKNMASSVLEESGSIMASSFNNHNMGIPNFDHNEGPICEAHDLTSNINGRNIKKEPVIVSMEEVKVNIGQDQHEIDSLVNQEQAYQKSPSKEEIRKTLEREERYNANREIDDNSIISGLLTYLFHIGSLDNFNMNKKLDRIVGKLEETVSKTVQEADSFDLKNIASKLLKAYEESVAEQGLRARNELRLDVLNKSGFNSESNVIPETIVEGLNNIERPSASPQIKKNKAKKMGCSGEKQCNIF